MACILHWQIGRFPAGTKSGFSYEQAGTWPWLINGFDVIRADIVNPGKLEKEVRPGIGRTGSRLGNPSRCLTEIITITYCLLILFPGQYI